MSQRSKMWVGVSLSKRSRQTQQFTKRPSYRHMGQITVVPVLQMHTSKQDYIIETNQDIRTQSKMPINAHKRTQPQ